MATIRDVAKLAGVGVGTASRVISGNGSVSAAARVAVERAARELNFRPSSTARSLSSGKTGLLGVLTPQFAGPYFGMALSVAERELRQAGRHMIVVSAHNDAENNWSDAKGLTSLIDRGVDGILHLSTSHAEKDLILASQLGPALAIINRRVPALADMCFHVDHYAAGRSVAKRMLADGHREFATISGPLSIEDARQRHEGFLDGLSEAGVFMDSALVLEGNFGMTSGRDAADLLLAEGKPFTALFCGNDEMAIAAHGQMIRAGRHPAVFGYDNMPLLDFAGIKISSVEIPIQEMVRNACRYLLNRCYGGEHPVIHEFGTRLVLR